MTGDAGGKLWGVGTGPGDPELLTLKAARVLESVPVIAHFAKKGSAGNARTICDGHFIREGVIELPLLYPVTTEVPQHEAGYREPIADFYEKSAIAVSEHLEAGRDVAVLSEGDPLFYGSYMHLHVRLSHRFPTEVVPGVTAMSGCWSAVGLPIVQGDDVLCVLPGTMPEEELVRRLTDAEACVIMKVGRNLPKIRRALAAAGRLDAAVYVERGTMPAMTTCRLTEKADGPAPYFSIVLVAGWSGRER